MHHGLDVTEYILKYGSLVGIKDKPRDHDWSLYLRSVTRVCMGRLNSVEIIDTLTMIVYLRHMTNYQIVKEVNR